MINIFTYKEKRYHPEQVKIFTQATYRSLIANMGMMIYISYFLHTYVPMSVMLIWLFSQAVHIILRVVLNRRLVGLLKTDAPMLKCVRLTNVLMFFNGLMWAIALLMAVLYAPFAVHMLILIAIFALAAGAIATLGAIVETYYVFMLGMMGASIVILFNQENQYAEGIIFILVLYLVIVLTTVQNNHKHLMNAINLKDELILINENLEMRIQEEVQHNKKQMQIIMNQSRIAQIGEMLNMISHQWRQPLAVISSMASTLHLELMLNECKKEDVTQALVSIEEYSENLSKTIHMFRSFFKTSEAKQICDLNELVKDAIGIVNASLDFHNVEVKINSLAKDTISTFPNELRHALLNIIQNSEDKLFERKIDNPFINITTYEDDYAQYIGIEDNAGGMPEEYLEKVFDPYFSTKPQKEGVGLGLYMSKMLIEEYCHGSLTVANSSIGALFTIRIEKV